MGNVWTYSDMSSKDSEAECYYNSLLQRCAAPSTECKQFLKTYACVSTFPQCDANGYQMGVCSDLCTQVEAVCGNLLLKVLSFWIVLVLLTLRQALARVPIIYLLLNLR